jgi:hypothetical protein
MIQKFLSKSYMIKAAVLVGMLMGFSQVQGSQVEKGGLVGETEKLKQGAAGLREKFGGVDKTTRDAAKSNTAEYLKRGGPLSGSCTKKCIDSGEKLCTDPKLKKDKEWCEKNCHDKYTLLKDTEYGQKGKPLDMSKRCPQAGTMTKEGKEPMGMSQNKGTRFEEGPAPTSGKGRTGY